MDLNTLVQTLFAGILAVLVAVALIWLYAAVGHWMDNAFETGRWIWFGFLMIFLFPASLFAWLIIRAMKNRPRSSRL